MFEQRDHIAEHVQYTTHVYKNIDYRLYIVYRPGINTKSIMCLWHCGGWEERSSLTCLYFVRKLKTLKTAAAVNSCYIFSARFFVLETS